LPYTDVYIRLILSYIQSLKKKKNLIETLKKKEANYIF